MTHFTPAHTSCVLGVARGDTLLFTSHLPQLREADADDDDDDDSTRLPITHTRENPAAEQSQWPSRRSDAFPLG